MYNKIPDEIKPAVVQLLTRTHITTADGAELKHRGVAMFDLCLGPVAMKKSFLIADIKDDVLLGADVIQKDVGGPADILLSEGKMLLRGQAVPIHQVVHTKVSQARNVRAADHYIIPPMSEKLVDVLLENLSSVDHGDDVLLLESDDNLPEKCQVVMASTLVDASRSATVKVRLMNPFDSPVSIKQDTVLGTAEGGCEVQGTLFDADGSAGSPHNGREKVRITQSSSIPNQLPNSLHEEDAPVLLPLHLQELYDAVCASKSSEERELIARLLTEYSDVFSISDDDLGLTHLTEHAIITGDAAPVKQAPRRVPIAFVGEEQKALEKLHRQGTIRPSTSPWASPIVLVKKKNGSTRPCVDYRRLNLLTEKDAFPLPRTSDCLDAVSGARVFSTLDITSAYNQIPVREADVPKTAFVTKYGLYEFTTMPFGLCNAPATFQRVMELALSGLQWNTCLIYLDDVIIFSKTHEEHADKLRSVLERIRAAGLKLKPSKCNLFQEEVTFLGHVISHEGILPNPDNVARLAKWPQPANVKEVRSFLGLGNYYRRFVKNYSTLVKPLTELTKKDRVFGWSEACQNAFTALKEALLGPEIMAYPSEIGDYILDTDACDVSIGAVLSQVQDGREKVIAYGSLTFNKAEKNYCVTDRELLAVKHFVKDMYKLAMCFVSDFNWKDMTLICQWNIILCAVKDKTTCYMEY